MPNAHLFALAIRMAALLGFPSAPRDVLGAIAAHAYDETDLAVGVTWAAHESGFDNFPEARSGDARAGIARCFFQIHSGLPLTLDDCASRWYRALRSGARLCGSVEGGLRAVSSGSCSRARGLVARRVDEALFVLQLVR